MNINSIQLEITANPLNLSMAERESFEISMQATNQGDETTDPQLYVVQLFVNEEESTVWNLAVSNGRRPPAWDELPPNETVAMKWSSLGESLFPDPGEYQLVFCYVDTCLEPIQVQVNP